MIERLEADADVLRLHASSPDGGLPPHPARVVCAVLQTDDRTYAVTVTVQGAEPENPTYKRDSEVILTGFQMLSPAR